MSQIPSISELQDQERTVRVANFDLNAAWFIGCQLREKAQVEKLPVAIEVYAFGQPLFLTVLPGACNEHLEWIARKRNTVLRNSRSSMLTGEQYREQGLAMETLPYIDHTRYTDSGGSFPLLTSDGLVIGAVTISGLASHDDHALAVWAIEQYISAS